jgi:nucleoside-diphosphate-sugar epimerase
MSIQTPSNRTFAESETHPLPAEDLAEAVARVGDLWEEFRGARLFITGGTGFFGRWVLETLLRANDLFSLDTQLLVLTRRPQRFAAIAPHVAMHSTVTLWQGDVRTFDLPTGRFTHVLHMATETALDASPMASLDTAVAGTTRVLDLAQRSGSSKLLLTSSGAVYGPQPSDLERLTEEYAGVPLPKNQTASYAEGKRAAESLCVAVARESNLEVKLARCFTFVGPLLPLDSNFAIGNFVRDVLAGEQIRVSGDGTPRRSYMYAADLAVWLWNILCRGESCRPYNVGSEHDLSILDLALLVTEVLRPGLGVQVAKDPFPGTTIKRYVPSTERAERELGLWMHMPLDEAIRRTALWYAEKSAT